MCQPVKICWGVWATTHQWKRCLEPCCHWAEKQFVGQNEATVQLRARRIPLTGCVKRQKWKKKKGYVPVHVWSTGSINQKCRYNYIFTVKHHSHVWSEFSIIVVHYIHQSGRLISTKLKSFPIKYRLHFMGSKGLKQADTFKLVNVWILSVVNWNIEF